MATIPDDQDTIEAQALSTSLDPYGQLLRMLLPRASCIAIYDRMGMPLWMSDGCDGPDIPQLIEEALAAAREVSSVAEERDGIQRSWGSDTGYVFVLREANELLGAVAVSCRGGKDTSRPFSFILGLLRPALRVLKRELCNQFSIGDLQRNLTLRDGDLELLLGAGDADGADSDEFEALLRNSVQHLDCALGALLLPDRKIALTCSSNQANVRADSEMVERVQRNLLAWSQVQRRTLTLNKPPPNNPFGTEAYKILACPVRQGGAQHVVGILVLFRSAASPDFTVRQVRIVEMVARRVAYVLQNAFDPATGLLSRAAFEQRALAVIGNGAGVKGQHCVAYADVDRLHVVNDNHGMHVGDEVIRAIADAIRGSLPPNCTASHISGDRFAMFLADTSIDAAEQLLANLCRNINGLDHRYDEKRLSLSLSVGVASVPSTKYPLSHALATAEVACKAAKDRGRGRVEAYQDADHSIVRRYEDMAFVGTLRDAIAGDRFRMEAQPIAHLGREGKPRRFELLLRMIDPAGESIPPDKFLSAAERYQLATDIDRWVVQYTLEILSAAAPLQALGAHFAINLSGQSIGDDEFPVFLEAKLREYNLPPSLLSFEITETAAVANIVRAEMLIRRLQDLGHDIALDDFGRGLSSLTYLKSLSVSDLKIDGGLVRDLAGNARSQAMVNAIVQLAQAMKLRTTAECVESEAIQATCTRLGVDYGQGFAIGRPRPLEAVLQELLRGAPGAPRSAPSARSRIAS